MAINDKIKVAVIGAANKSILLNPKATEGAVFGKDLFFGDGKTVVTLQSLATALGITKQSAQPVVLWNQLAAIPPNVIQVANLSTAGVVRRLPNGTWITQPPTDFLGRPGPPGRRGHRGPPGIPGLKGASGLAGSAGTMMPARRGPRGKQGFPGTPGARGATGPQGPSGSGTSASGFPGYRQRAARRPQFTPWVDKNAGNVWSGPQTFNVPQFGAALILGNTAGIPILFTVPDNTAGFTLRATGNTHGCGFSLQTSTNTDLGWLGLGDWALAGAAVNDVTLNCATGTLRLTVGGTPRFVLTQAGNISLNAPSGGNVILQLNGTGMLSVGTSGASYNTPTGTTHTLRINAVELITFNGAATTGAFAATFAAANKPGLATSPSVGRWLPVMFGGTQFYIPMWQ